MSKKSSLFFFSSIALLISFSSQIILLGPKRNGFGIILFLAHLTTVDELIFSFLATSFLLKYIDFIATTPIKVNLNFLKPSPLDLLIYLEVLACLNTRNKILTFSFVMNKFNLL